MPERRRFMASQGTATSPLEAMEPMTAEKPELEPSTKSSLSGWIVWLAPLLSAGLLYASFFPIACGWLAWVALVPWLYLVRSEARPRNLYLSAFLGGLLFFWPVLSWMRVADE